MADPTNITGEQQQIKTETQVTPEEKLFRLIAAAGKEDAELQDLLTRFAQPKKKKGWKIGDRSLDLSPVLGQKVAASPVVRSAALVFLGAVAFYFLSGIHPGQTFYISPGSRLGEVGITHAVDLFPKFFTQGAAQPPAVTGAGTFQTLPAAVPTSAVTVPIKDDRPFRLVGISWDAQGPVAMIETGRAERAKFARKGDVLDGNVKIDDIKDYTVTLSSGLKKWELT
jgi:hypothetical protein